ncbi:MAG: HEAT repeat domain-containing protein [Planctomycetota bacterium]
MPLLKKLPKNFLALFLMALMCLYVLTKWLLAGHGGNLYVVLPLIGLVVVLVLAFAGLVVASSIREWRSRDSRRRLKAPAGDESKLEAEVASAKKSRNVAIWVFWILDIMLVALLGAALDHELGLFTQLSRDHDNLVASFDELQRQADTLGVDLRSKTREYQTVSALLWDSLRASQQSESGDLDRSRARDAAVALLDESSLQVPDVHLRSLRDPRPHVRRAATLALPRYKERAMEIVPALEHTAADLGEDPDVRASATLGLGELGSVAKAAVPTIVRLLEDQDPRLRASAAEALGRVSEGEANEVRALEKATHDENAEVRQRAEEALERVKERVAAKSSTDRLTAKLGDMPGVVLEDLDRACSPLLPVSLPFDVDRAALQDLLAAALCLEESDRPDDALRVYEVILARDPRCPDALWAVARLLASREGQVESLRILKNAAQLLANAKEPFLEGLIYLEMHKVRGTVGATAQAELARATAAFESAIGEGRLLLEGHIARAFSHLKSGDLDTCIDDIGRAETLFQKGLRPTPRDVARLADYLTVLAARLVEIERTEAANRALRLADDILRSALQDRAAAWCGAASALVRLHETASRYATNLEADSRTSLRLWIEATVTKLDAVLQWMEGFHQVRASTPAVMTDIVAALAARRDGLDLILGMGVSLVAKLKPLATDSALAREEKAFEQAVLCFKRLFDSLFAAR